MKITQKQIKEAKECWIPEYRNQVSDAKAIGKIISSQFDWDCNQIVETMITALEDANYHSLVNHIEEFLKEEK